MFALGLPISQAAASTILGVLGLYLSPSYIFVTFFKMVFLVIVLGALHGLLLLPVLLSWFGPGMCERRRRRPRRKQSELDTTTTENDFGRRTSRKSSVEVSTRTQSVSSPGRSRIVGSLLRPLKPISNKCLRFTSGIPFMRTISAAAFRWLGSRCCE